MAHLERWEKPITEICGIHDDDIIIMQDPAAVPYHHLNDEVFVDYNKSFFKTKTLKYWTVKYLKALPQDVTHLICRGASGTSIASAMTVMSDRELKIFVIRKEGENAHSIYIGGYQADAYEPLNCVCAIVDDFVSSGNTVKEIVDSISFYSITVKYLLTSGFTGKIQHEFIDCTGNIINYINVTYFK